MSIERRHVEMGSRKGCWLIIASLIFAFILMGFIPQRGVISARSSSSNVWVDDGIAISASPADQSWSQIIPDGDGGAIMTWEDERAGNIDIYAQRVTKDGEHLWALDGVRVCAEGSQQRWPQIAPDGSGGALITWVDYRNSLADIYAQRIGADGDIIWSSNGVVICNDPEGQWTPRIAPDGDGGAVITWEDYRSQADLDVYAQRINGSGVVQWNPNGVAIATASGNQSSPEIVSADNGSVIVTWEDKRSGTDWDIYAQKLDITGAALWTPGGIAVETGAGNQDKPRLVWDGSNGTVITWTSNGGGSLDLYAQRIDASGNLMWPGGVLVCGASDHQGQQVITTDGEYGAIIAWQDSRGSSGDIYAQRVNLFGTTLWTADGVAICAASGDQIIPAIAPTNGGGAVIGWQDGRNGSADIYAQIVDADGGITKEVDGTPVCSASGDQTYPHIAANDAGGAVLVWIDSRGSDKDVYAMRTGPVTVTGYVNVNYFYVPSNELISFGLNGVVVEAVEEGTQQVTASATTMGMIWFPETWGRYELVLEDGWSGSVRIAEMPYPIWNGYLPDEHEIDKLFVELQADFIVRHEQISTWSEGELPITAVEADAGDPQIITDGMGGAITAWPDQRNDAGDIFVQRIYRDGDSFWPENGIAVCEAEELQTAPQIAPNGYEGAIVCWQDNRGTSTDIYAQGINGWGDLTWTQDGVLVGSGEGNQLLPQISTDAAGAPTIVWQDDRGPEYDIYAAVQSLEHEIAICTADGTQMLPRITYNPPGNIVSGAIIVWMDYRYGSADIYAQRVEYWENGIDWAANGVPVCTAPNSQLFPEVIYDDDEGAFVVWQDQRDEPSGGDIYAQRITKYGNIPAPWPVDGAAVCADLSLQESPAAVRDGEGNFIVVWTDSRTNPGTNSDIYAQRVAGDGQIVWQANGICVCTAEGFQVSPGIAPDGGGNFLVTWIDLRDGNSDIYAQRIDPDGNILGAPQGFPVVTEAGSQDKARTISDGSSNTGVYITWLDGRGVHSDVYASRVKSAFSISGYVKTQAGIGAEGITVDAIEKNDMVSLVPTASDVTDIWGYYEIYLEDGWEGILSPQPTDWFDKFSPSISMYYVVDGDITEQNYTAYHEGFEWYDEWAVDGIVVSDAPYNQGDFQIVRDGLSGAIVVWKDSRISGNNGDIYAQRIGPSGKTLWTEDGIVVCATTAAQNNPQIVADGEGGCFVLWEDQRSGNYDLYIQRIFPSGGTLWQDEKKICDAARNQINSSLIRDADGDFILTWQDHRDTDAPEIYAQKFDINGNTLWSPANGVMITTKRYKGGKFIPPPHGYYKKYNPDLVSDGSGGAIISWREVEPGDDTWISARRINGGGSVLWNENGIIIAASTTSNPQMIEDGSNGAVISYTKSGRVYASRINPSGTLPWDEKQVSSLSVSPGNFRLISDESDGSVLAFCASNNVYAQRLNSSGDRLWGSTGFQVCDDANGQSDARITRDDSGYFVITWLDNRHGSHHDIYAQKLDLNHGIYWHTNGVVVCKNGASQSTPEIAGDGAGGAFIAWIDYRNGNDDIYAQRINDLDILAHVTSNVPDDSFIFTCPAGNTAECAVDSFFVSVDIHGEYLTIDESQMTIELQEPEGEGIELFDEGDEGPRENLGNLIHTAIIYRAIGGCGTCGIPVLINGDPEGDPAFLSVRSPDLDANGIVDLVDFTAFCDVYPSPPKEYNSCMDYNGDGLVELIDLSTFSMHYQHIYQQGGGAIASTSPEESATGMGIRLSRPGDGSGLVLVDLNLRSAEEFSTLVLGIRYDEERMTFLDWSQREEFRGNTVMAPIQRNGEDILFLGIYDSGAIGGEDLEVGTITLRTVDNADVSLPGDLEPVIGEFLTADGRIMRLKGIEIEDAEDDVPVALRNFLGQNYPNPFNPSTTIEFSIASDSYVNLSIYNVKGQLIRRLIDRPMRRDHYKVKWNGRNNRGCPVASGAYFYRLKTESFTRTKKLIMLR